MTMALLLAAIGGSAFASLSTSDLIVLYNSAGPNDYYDWSVSKSIADAYVQARRSGPVSGDRRVLALCRRIHNARVFRGIYP